LGPLPFHEQARGARLKHIYRLLYFGMNANCKQMILKVLQNVKIDREERIGSAWPFQLVNREGRSGSGRPFQVVRAAIASE